MYKHRTINTCTMLTYTVVVIVRKLSLELICYVKMFKSLVELFLTNYT